MQLFLLLLLCAPVYGEPERFDENCSASFETACSVTLTYNLVVEMQQIFQAANQSEFQRLIAEINQYRGPFVNKIPDLYGSIFRRNGTCGGHPTICSKLSGTNSVAEYIEKNEVFTTPDIASAFGATAYSTGGAEIGNMNQTEGLGGWIWYYWLNVLKRTMVLPVQPTWAPGEDYYVGVGFNDVAANGLNLQSPHQCSSTKFALCAADIAMQVSQEFRARILRLTTAEDLQQFFNNVTGHNDSTRVFDFRADIYGIAEDNYTGTILAHNDWDLLYKPVIGNLGASPASDADVWSTFIKGAFGQKFGQWIRYGAHTSRTNNLTVERFSFCLYVRPNPGTTNYSHLMVQSSFDRVYDARAEHSNLRRLVTGYLWIGKEVVFLVDVGNEVGQRYFPDDPAVWQPFLKVQPNCSPLQPTAEDPCANLIVTVTLLPNGTYRIRVTNPVAAVVDLQIAILETYQDKNETSWVPVTNSPARFSFFDPSNIVLLQDWAMWAFGVLTGISMITIVWFMIWTIRNRASRIVFASSVDFMLLTASGLVVALTSVLISLLAPYNAGACSYQLSLWLQHLGTILAETAMVVKAYRLHRIFNNAKLQITVLPRKHLYGVVGLAVAIQSSMLLVATVVYPSVPKQLDGTLSGESGSDGQQLCVAASDFGFLLAKVGMCLFEALAVLCVLVLAYQLRNIPVRYNESKWLGLSSLNAGVVGSFYLLIFINRVDSELLQFFTSFCVLWVCTFTAALLFLPKVHMQRKKSSTETSTSLLSKSFSSNLDKKLLPETLVDEIRQKDNALAVARANQARLLEKYEKSKEEVARCEAQLYDSVGELAFQNKGQEDGWSLIGRFRTAIGVTPNPPEHRASINHDETR